MGHINDMKKMMIVCGPTATGKTDCALRLAKKIGGELISADSRQIYRGMDIGTGKDLRSRKTIDQLQLEVEYNSKYFSLVPYDMETIPLWMCDVVNPDEEFSVAHYHHLADRVIDSVIERGNIPILVGGTGLYIRSVVHPFETAEIRPDVELRNLLKNSSLILLQDMVQNEVPEAWNAMNMSDRSNPYRLIRKLEIFRSKNIVQKSESVQRDICAIGLTAQNEELYARIDARVEKRIGQGLLDEIQTLLSDGYTWHHQSMNTLGYKEWKDWFEKPIDRSQDMKDAIVRKWQFDEHAYARRQMTWFRKEKKITWFDVTNPDTEKNIMDTVSAWYNTKR